MKNFIALLTFLLYFQGISCSAQAGGPSAVFSGAPPVPSPTSTFGSILNGANAAPANNSPFSATADAGAISAFSAFPFGPYAWWVYVHVDFPISQLTNYPESFPEVAGLQQRDGTFIRDIGCPPTDPCSFILAPPLPPIGPPFIIGGFYPPIPRLPPTFVDGLFAVTAKQLEALEAGHWYVNVTFATTNGIHLPGYTIRGQLLPPDNDHDGVPDYRDACLDTPSGQVVDNHGCSIEQLCPCEAPWENHGEYLKCLKAVTTHFHHAKLISERARRAILRQAEHSDCGRPDAEEGQDDHKDK